MADMKKTKFVEIIVGLAATHRVNADRAMLTGYWRALRDLDLESVERAAERAEQTLRHFPKPAELRELAGVPKAVHAARLAWVGVAEAARSSSWPKDRLSAEVVKHMGGPQRLGQMDAEDLAKWGRRQFEEIYITLAENYDIQKLLAHDAPGQLGEGAAKIVGELAGKPSKGPDDA